MLTLRDEFSTIVAQFAPLLSRRVWVHAQVLLIGTLLVRGQRTVTAALRVMGLSDEADFVNYHRVLQSAGLCCSCWCESSLRRGPSSLGVMRQRQIKRRRGNQIKAKGVYRDPVRSSHSHFVKASGLPWVTLMPSRTGVPPVLAARTVLLVPIPFAERVWALPFLTLLAPSERYYEEKVRAAKKLTGCGKACCKCAGGWRTASSCL